MSDVNAPVLVVNTGWTPIHIKSVKEAVSDVFAEVAEIVEHSDHEIIHPKADGNDIYSSAYTGHQWSRWSELSGTAIPFLRAKAAEYREEAVALRAEAKVMVDPAMALALEAEAVELDIKAKATDPRVIMVNRGLEIRGPEVIRLLDYYDIPDLEIRLTRKNLLLRDNFTCQYCGKRVSTSNFTIDHVMPKSRGGDGSWENFVVACFKCNVAKRDRTPKEAGLVLRTKPTKPKWYPLTTRFAFKTPASWVKFLPQSAVNNRPTVPELDPTETEAFASRRKK